MGMHGRYRHRGLLLGCELRVGRELAQTELVVDLFARRAQQRQAIKEILPPILPPVGIFEVVDLADLIMIDTVVPQSPLDERKALPRLDRRFKACERLDPALVQDLQRLQPLLGRTCVRFPFPALFLVQKGQRRSDSDALPEGTKEVEIAQHPFPALRKHRHGRVIGVEKRERLARRLSPSALSQYTSPTKESRICSV